MKLVLVVFVQHDGRVEASLGIDRNEQAKKVTQHSAVSGRQNFFVIFSPKSVLRFLLDLSLLHSRSRIGLAQI